MATWTDVKNINNAPLNLLYLQEGDRESVLEKVAVRIFEKGNDQNKEREIWIQDLATNKLRKTLDDPASIIRAVKM